MKFNLYILLVITAVQLNCAFGQKKTELVYTNTSFQQYIKHPKTQFKDSISAIEYLRDLQYSAIGDGFLLASVDSIVFHPNKYEVAFELGPRFGSISLEVEPEEVEFLEKNGRISEKLLSQIPFTPKEFERLLVRVNKTYVNNGYPFIKYTLTNTNITANNLTAKLAIDRGPEMIWQKIHVKGESRISDTYVSNLLEINEGDYYNESQLLVISQRIRQIAFLEEIKAHEVLFTEDGCELFLYLKSVKISTANGVLGLQPDAELGRVTVTGDLRLKLLSLLNRGELLQFHWQSIRAQTQSLDLRFNIPYLFKTPFGVDAQFSMYKRDTSFLEVQSEFGVVYSINSGNYLKGYYENISSNVLSGGNNNTTFSNLGNARTNLYGLAFSSTELDYIPNPRSGRSLYFEGSVGDRKSQKTDSSEVISSFTYRGKAEIEFFIPLYKKHVLRLANNTYFYGADQIFENELYRFGGLNSQRGFNEDELFANVHNTSTVEYRFLLDRNSHTFAFYDISWYENAAVDYYNDTPSGFGVGFAFNSNLGVFSISYALGKQLDNPILFSDGKIHFGYIAYL